MGAPTSGFAADIFMQALERRALTTFANPPRIWKGYVDDGWAVILLMFLMAFLDHLNALHRRIRWTHEEMVERCLPYLDAATKAEEDGELTFNIYRKPTHTNQYLNFDSNHHVGHKLSVVRTMNIRAESLITKEEDVESEKALLKEAFLNCKYPLWAINYHESVKNKEKKQEEEPPIGKVVAPYIKSTSEKLAMIFKKYNLVTIHKPINKLKGKVCTMKQPVHPMDRDGAIYDVNCKKHTPDPKTILYGGESDRPTKERGYEHRAVSAHDATKCHSCVPFEVEPEAINEPEPPIRRSNRNKGRVNYADLANTGTRTSILDSQDETLEPAEVRRSQRIASKPAVNYARMNQGPKHLTIGKSEPSKHFVEFDHEDDDLTITPIDYSQNYYHRGLKEAIRIYEKWPCINQDEGRTYLPPIYHNLLSRPPAKPEMTNIQDETTNRP